jgi:hypothetical protein
VTLFVQYIQSYAAPRRTMLAASCALAAVLGAGVPAAQANTTKLAGTLLTTESVYVGTRKSVVVGQALPNSSGVTAVADGTYPTVFANDAVDANFGITSPILVTAQEVAFDKKGARLFGPTNEVNITDLTGISTSFSSKSELEINLSTDGTALTFMGYAAPVNELDASNANTPDNIDPTNTDIQSPTYRAVVEVDLGGSVSATPVDSYSGNNGRGAILARNANGSGQDEYLTVGNAGNGSGTEPTNIVNDTGVQEVTPGAGPVTNVIGVQQGTPGSKDGFQYGFAVQQIGDPEDKSGKDDNFRGSTILSNNLYVSKGSGSNGVNTVYQVSAPGGGLPLAGDAASTQISILPGLPTNLAANIVEGDPTTEFYPFGIWFANATTMYVADEGSQDLNADPNAGLQKWVFDGAQWNLAYVIQNGLNLDQPYPVLNYPQNYFPATTGLRHLSGIVNGKEAIIFATTATYSNLADPGADPNQVVEIVDDVNATTLPTGEAFAVAKKPRALHVYRGVEFYPGAATLPAAR